MDISEKLKEIRYNERLTQKELADMVEMPYGTYKNYESGFRRAASSIEIFKILSHPRFQKYIFWFVTGDADLNVQQVSPVSYKE